LVLPSVCHVDIFSHPPRDAKVQHDAPDLPHCVGDVLWR
jgi:hypothetical protein